ncbi:bile acid:sodium symporter family protein [Sinomicrobium oceani]|uniref:bile acid:sodium symporter family protein n=1 Tax=Sinomicrobium oceani TaxID=1150368 RepID=UPI00227A7AE9|nr:bile acid:sodium symporter family protein [Sinomicrobium oceani]
MIKTKKIYNIILVLSGLFLLSFVVCLFTGYVAKAGPLLTIFFILLSISFYGYMQLRSYVYTVMIFAAVSLAMYYPEYFLEVNGFKLTGLITPLIQVIMFGMGTSMSAGDFLAVAKEPKGVFVGVTAQFIIMPLSGYLLALISGFSGEIAAGIVLIGCSPSGMASNVMAYLARANLALSLTITSIATLVAPFLTPLLMKMLAGEFIAIDVLTMMWGIVKMIIIPIGAGLIFNKLIRGKSTWIDKVMPIVSMAGIALIIVVITAAGRDSLLDIGLLLILLVLIHNIFGYTMGYWYGRFFRLSEKDCRTIAIEVGMQNGGLASAIANNLGKIATMGLAPAIFGPLMNVTGSVLASFWHKRPIPEKSSVEAQGKI